MEEEFVKPPEPIRINKLFLDTVGIFTIQANGDVDWPESIRNLFNLTQELKSQNLKNSEIRRRLKSGLGGDGNSGIEKVFTFIFEEVISTKQYPISPENLMIEDLTDREMKIRITFESPELISIRDQSIQDRLVIGLVTPLVGINGLEMSTEGFIVEGSELRTNREI